MNGAPAIGGDSFETVPGHNMRRFESEGRIFFFLFSFAMRLISDVSDEQGK